MEGTSSEEGGGRPAVCKIKADGKLEYVALYGKECHSSD